MSLNNSLNAVIALIENQPDIARAYFRDPNSDIINVGQSTARLYAALDKRFAIELRMLLVKILEAQPNKTGMVTRYDDAFYDGVRSAEQIIETVLIKLES